RVTDPAPDQIVRGSSTVFIGGKTFPFDVKKLPNGDIQVGKNMKIKGDEPFQDKTLERLGDIANTKRGEDTLKRIDNSGKSMDISEFKGDNSFAGPRDFQAATPKGQPVFDGAGNPINGPDGKQLLGTGTGSDVDLQFNPDLTLPNSLDPTDPLP